MKLDEFQIGKQFSCGDRTWICTDKGTRTVIAICISPRSRKNDWLRGVDVFDPSWFAGPPYAVEEHVFDEYDQKVCESS